MNDFLLLDDTRQRTWIATRGLHEFELLQNDEGARVAVTVNRSVGLLSTGNGRIRRVQAGPAIPRTRRAVPQDHHGRPRPGDGARIAKKSRPFNRPEASHTRSGCVKCRTCRISRPPGHVSKSSLHRHHRTIPWLRFPSFRLHPDGETAGAARIQSQR